MTKFITGYVFGGYVEGDTDDYKEWNIEDGHAIKLASIGLSPDMLRYIEAKYSEPPKPPIFDLVFTKYGGFPPSTKPKLSKPLRRKARLNIK